MKSCQIIHHQSIILQLFLILVISYQILTILKNKASEGHIKCDVVLGVHLVSL